MKGLLWGRKQSSELGQERTFTTGVLCDVDRELGRGHSDKCQPSCIYAR
jgi:hypothetical protein